MTKNNSIRLTILGAAQTVTGSKYLVETSSSKVLVDCGLFQGKKELRLRNWEKPKFDAAELDAVVLTHAHIDHTGYLPCLIRQGFRAPIFCTEATAAITRLLLVDSAHLQEEEARYANEHGTSKHKPAKPLYTQQEAREVLELLRPVSRKATTSLTKDCTVSFTCAGHILGATSLSLNISGRRITFSGDIGRYDAPILPDPQPHPLGDIFLCESTYGNREHELEKTEDHLVRIIGQVISRRGPLIIPAFAIGRTQTLLYYIAKLEREGRIPVLPVYVDSPMAIDATKIYREYKHDYDDEAAALVRDGYSPIVTGRTNYCTTVEQSKKLNSSTGPRIVISASGMVNGGRIMHHMLRWLPEEETTVLFVGYQAEETRGRTILSGAKTVRIFGREVPIRAHVEEISGLSAHGDRNELIRWLKSCRGTPNHVRIVHGEPDASRAFSDTLKKEFGWDARPAQHLEQIELE